MCTVQWGHTPVNSCWVPPSHDLRRLVTEPALNNHPRYILIQYIQVASIHHQLHTYIHTYVHGVLSRWVVDRQYMQYALLYCTHIATYSTTCCTEHTLQQAEVQFKWTNIVSAKTPSVYRYISCADYSTYIRTYVHSIWNACHCHTYVYAQSYINAHRPWTHWQTLLTYAEWHKLVL